MECEARSLAHLGFQLIIYKTKLFHPLHSYYEGDIKYLADVIINDT